MISSVALGALVPITSFSKCWVVLLMFRCAVAGVRCDIEFVLVICGFSGSSTVFSVFFGLHDSAEVHS